MINLVISPIRMFDIHATTKWNWGKHLFELVVTLIMGDITKLNGVSDIILLFH